VDARRIDPRDTRWEVETPRYRVHFERRRPQPDGHGDAYESDEYEITEATDVRQVLAWAHEAAANDQGYGVYVLVGNDSSSLGLVRVARTDAG
jgi:hypothetical protein